MSRRKKYVPVEGVRIKYRTHRDEDGQAWCVATLWLDDKLTRTLATLDFDLVKDPGDPLYQEWVDFVSRIHARKIEELSGVEGVKGLRRKPRYKGESGKP